jgi:hypothetical protein
MNTVVTESPTDKEEEEGVLFSHECDKMPKLLGNFVI